MKTAFELAYDKTLKVVNGYVGKVDGFSYRCNNFDGGTLYLHLYLHGVHMELDIDRNSQKVSGQINNEDDFTNVIALQKVAQKVLTIFGAARRVNKMQEIKNK